MPEAQPTQALLTHPETGEVGYFDTSQLPEAFNRGYKFASEQQIREQAKKEYFGSQPFKAAALAGAEGISGGLVDPLLSESGILPKETIQGLHQYNPRITTAGKVGGFAAGLFLGSSEESALAQGAGAVPKAITGLGGLTEAGIERGLLKAGIGKATEEGISYAGENLAKQVLAGSLRLGGRSAVESATMGAMNQIDENYLGNHELNAEKLLAGVGQAALLSGEYAGGAGLIFGGAPPIIAKALHGVANTNDIRDKIVNWRNSSIDKAKQEAMEKLPYASEEVSNAFDKLKTPEGVQDVGEALARGKSKFLPKQDAAALQDSLSNLHKEINSGLKNMNTEKFGEFGDLLKATKEGEMSPPPATQTAMEAEFPAPARPMADQGAFPPPPGVRAAEFPKPTRGAIPSATDLIEKESGPVGFDAQKAASAIQEHVNGAVSKLEEMEKDPITYKTAMVRDIKQKYLSLGEKASDPNLNAIDMFKEVHNTRKLIDQTLKDFRKDPSVEVTKAASVVRGLRDDTRDILKDSDIWGDAGSRYGQINDTLHDYYKFVPPNNAPTDFTKAFMKWNRDKGAWEFNPTQTKKILSDPLNPSIQAKQKLLNSYFDAVDPLSQQIAKVQAATGTDKLMPEALSSLRDAVRQRTEESSGDYALTNILKNIKAERPVEPIASQVIDSTLGNLGNMPLIGGAAQFLKLDKVGKFIADRFTRSPNEAFMKNYQLQQALYAVDDKLSAFADTLSKVAPKVAEKAAYMGQLAKPLVNKAIADQVTKPDNPDWKKRQDEITYWANNPDKFTKAMTANAGQLANHAPNTAAILAANLINNLNYIQDKFPKNPNPALDQFTQAKWQPSDADIAKLERYYAGTFNPMTVFQDLSNGIANNEGIEALKSQHNNLYQQFVANVIKNASQTELPYDRRVALSALFGQPMDVSMKPEFISAIQMGVYGMGQQPPSMMAPMGHHGGGGMKNRKPSAKFTKLSQADFSASDRLMARKGF